MRKVVVLCGAVTLAAMLVSACKPIPPGGSSSVAKISAKVSGGLIVVQAPSGQNNNISVYGGYITDNHGHFEGPYTIIHSKSGHKIAGSDGCANAPVDGAISDYYVYCSWQLRAEVRLGDGNDTGLMTYSSECAARGAQGCWPKLATHFYGEAGNDTLSGDNTKQYGGDGNDILNGGKGNETLDGGPGNDILRGGLGADIIDCGPGTDDWASYHDSDAAIQVQLGGVANGGHATGDTVKDSCENLGGTAYNDELAGNQYNNRIHGEPGNDTINGFGGNDDIQGMSGDDILVGHAGADNIGCGVGNDWVSYWGSTAGVTVTLGGSGSGGHAQGDTISNECENVGGSMYNDHIVGNEKNNQINGEKGNDAIFGGEGWDILNGGDGDDAMNGGPGGDNIDCGNGAGDFVSYWNSPTRVIATLGGTGSAGDAASDIIAWSCEALEGSPYNDQLFGNSGANRLKGFEGDDVLYSYGGNDTLDGGPGIDALNGGQGADVLECGPDHDHVSYWDSPQAVSVTIGGTSTGGDAQGDKVANSCEQVDGSEYDDVIVGNNSANVLKGFGGNDVIYGLGHDDRIEGGPGNDTIVTNGDSANGFHDTIDCGSGTDAIIFDKDTPTGCEATDGNQTLPVLLVHGFDAITVTAPGGSCSDQWQAFKNILTSRGYTGSLRTIGYYAGDYACDLYLENKASTGTHTPIEELAKRLAKLINAHYGNQPVNLVGYSMGGLIIKRMLLEVRNGTAGFPAVKVANLVTVQSPLAGAAAAHLCTSTQCVQMRPGSTFLTWMAQKDALGFGTTDVTVIGSSGDQLVSAASATSGAANHKVNFLSPSYGHIFGRVYDDAGTAYNASADYTDAPNSNSWWGWSGRAPHGGTWIFNALKSQNW